MPGPPPKRNRARTTRHGGVDKFRDVEVVAYEQPSLTKMFGTRNPLDAKFVSKEEPDADKFLPITKRMWKALADYPPTALLQEPQWYLLGGAVCAWDMAMKGRGAMWATEARLQLANYGIAPHDLLRLRINMVDAEAKEDTQRRRRSAEAKRVESSKRKRAITDLGDGVIDGG